MKTMLVLGASSDIARAIAVQFGKNGWDLILTARDEAKGKRIGDDIGLRLNRSVAVLQFEAGKTDAAQFWGDLPARPDAVLCAIGFLGSQEQARHDARLAAKILQANFCALIPILNIAADAFEKSGDGLIIGISSVAGERGRESNYIYGAAKAGFSAYLSGLRQRLHKCGARVMTVKPGFVDTSMTEGMRLSPLLTVSPDSLAETVYKAYLKGKDVVYSQFVWKPIMTIIKFIPEPVFKRMSV